MAQLYLMECILHTFPDEWHAATLETLLLHTTQLQPGNDAQPPSARTKPQPRNCARRTKRRRSHAPPPGRCMLTLPQSSQQGLGCVSRAHRQGSPSPRPALTPGLRLRLRLRPAAAQASTSSRSSCN